LAILEWVDIGVAEPETPKAEKPETKAEGEKKPKAKRAKKKAGETAEATK
jgi:hypothetical protein